MKTNGQIEKLHVAITHPMKMEDNDLTLNKLTLLTGQNGTGKTFFMVNIYALSAILATIVEASHDGIKLDENQVAQYIYDNCFSDQNIDGTVGALYENNATIHVVFDKGKVTSVNHMGLETLEHGAPATFMSKNMRTFDQIQHYMKLRNMIALSSPTTPILEEMLNHYRLYDVTYVEKLILRMPKEVTEQMRNSFANFDIKENIISFGYDSDKVDFYVIIKDGDKEEKKYLTTYGAGHQSLLNMILGNNP